MGKRIACYKTDFVEYIPKRLEPGVLYVSVEYKVAAHLCACGCEAEIVTPIDRNSGWIMTYDGENVSLSPSIGNGRYECCSHYFLKNGIVEWLPSLEQDHIVGMTKKNSWFAKIIAMIKKR